MKITKRKRSTTETFETTIIRLRQNPKDVFCADCGKEVLKFPIDETIFAQKLDEQEDVVLCKTSQGKFLLIEIH